MLIRPKSISGQWNSHSLIKRLSRICEVSGTQEVEAAGQQAVSRCHQLGASEIASEGFEVIDSEDKTKAPFRSILLSQAGYRSMQVQLILTVRSPFSMARIAGRF